MLIKTESFELSTGVKNESPIGENLLCFYWDMQECNAKTNDSEVVEHETTWSLFFDFILKNPAELENLKKKNYEENKHDSNHT